MVTTSAVRLQPPDTAFTLAVRDGSVVRTDGPFAETKEQIGGIHCIEVTDRDEAEQIASWLTALKFCTVEVRPVLGIDLRGAVFDMHHE